MRPNTQPNRCTLNAGRYGQPARVQARQACCSPLSTPRPIRPPRGILVGRNRQDDGVVRGDALQHRGGRDRQVQGAARDRRRRHPRRRVQVGRRGADRRVQGSQVLEGRGRDRGLPRAPGGPGRRGGPLEEEGRLHAGVGADPRGPREGRSGVGHPGQEDQGRRGGGPDGRGCLPPRQPDRAAARAQHRRAAGAELRVQDHQAQQAPPQHRGEPARAARGGAQDQARRPHEGAAGRPGAEGHREEHHRFRRLHRPGRRGRAAAHHRHELRARVASLRDGEDRPGGRSQGPRHRLGARAHQPRLEAAAGLPVEERGREVSGRHARAGQGRVDHQLRRVRGARAGDRGAGAHLRDELDPQRAPSVQDRLDRRNDRSRRAEGR